MEFSRVLSKDLVAGLVFVTIGLGFLWGGLDYRVGTVSEMGPGFFPVSLAILLIALGAVVALKSLTGVRESLESVNLRGIVFVIGATALFGILIRPAGMLIAVFVLTALGAFASMQFRARNAVLLAVGLTVFCLVIFNWGLGMPFPVLGYWLQ
ncbi:tripartite tricarboxylate transporter TctB family protein (plasmid) [Rhizobium ruizarguesonis]|uniref:tripartite tricarboxylate transporter TctB family protein n=1 Tax=Rhizobium TaxID=379 RepID=UPI001030B5CD|nr:tripartite tricarboxylate transporter TctB family protein [Rhizobium ruizarguesonis]MBB3649145.1 putative tricarboxylic transport membrane protein [Rhizobium sp. BK619]MBY5882453.1 tripartite tricarboxylate transporter TctB family protein [Rhizobium leguminosarum]NKL12685.1 tripartite tricarboxylate transporter TctB family protein [Rhizobium leguminosarum bv. viciae]NKL41787.1 tripartite tricarboxylate transporter TctB family protein [Rhizobium leguminosarum bv. viciae]NKL67334.1 tripartite